MTDTPGEPPPHPSSGEPVEWTPAGPVSPRFGDVYFSASDGLEETRAVYLAGCGLPDAWRDRGRFTVAELGFGTGLNVLALLELWSRTRPSPGARLSIMSVEGFPMRREDAARALAAWPELAILAKPLLHRWPQGRRGLHRYAWPALGATLDLLIDEVQPALDGWTRRADAWFLDGFAPSKNAQMWSEPVLAAVAQRSAPGARLATFTVAGAVRRTLAAHGLQVDKRPGFGRKSERLEATAPGVPQADPPPPDVAVIGAGIAGAALARALTLQGCQVTVVERSGEGAGASGNAAALVTPRLDAGGGPAARLHALAFARATALYDDETPQAVIAGGALQLERTERDPERFARLAVFDGFDAGSVRLLPAAETGPLLDEPTADGALWLDQARVIEPAPLLSAWLSTATGVSANVAALEPAPSGGWRLLGADGRCVLEATVVVVAAGAGATSLLPGLKLRPVRGQASTAQTAFSGAPAAWGGYAIPTREGVLFGASHTPGDATEHINPGDAEANLDRLAQGRPALATKVHALPPAQRSERAGVRTAVRDHMPVTGAVGGAPGLFVLGGLGGRGYTLAPLLAEHVAALVVGAPSPLPLPLQAAVSASRRAVVQEQAPRGPVSPPRRRPAPPKREP